MAVPPLAVDLYVNAQSRILVDSEGAELSSIEAPQFFREEVILLRFHVVDDANAAYVMAVTDAFEFGADVDFADAASVDLLSEDGEFNISGDWADTDPTIGLICCRVSTNTTNFNTAIASLEELLAGCYLKRSTDIVTPWWTTLFDFSCYYRGIRRSNALVPTAVTTPTYLTSAQTTAYIDAYTPPTLKAVPVDADTLTLWDSAAAFARKHFTWANLKTAIGLLFVPRSLYDANTILAADADDVPAAVTVAEQTLVGRITAGNITALTTAEVLTLLSISASADTVLNALFDANTILAADSDNTPAAVTVAEQTLLGRITGGNIAALSIAQIQTLLGIATPPVLSVQVKTADYDAVAADELIIFDKATAVATALPEATGSGRPITFKTLGAGTLTITALATGTPDLIDGEATIQLAVPYEAVTLVDYVANKWAVI